MTARDRLAAAQVRLRDLGATPAALPAVELTDAELDVLAADEAARADLLDAARPRLADAVDPDNWAERERRRRRLYGLEASAGT